MIEYSAQFYFLGLMFFGALVCSWLLTRIVLSLALRFGWTAKANSRSSHVGQLAFGGGISIILVSLLTWGVLSLPMSQIQLVVLVSVLVLAVVSWFDDLNNLPSGLRFVVHIGVVGVCLFVLPGEQRVLPFEFPLLADRVLAGFFWLWFINLFNFMDGIDGLAGVETVFVAFGVVVIGVLVGLGPEWNLLAVLISGAALGFLPWNWHKARIMLGDLGSVPLGFLLIQLSLAGNWVAALILPSYFVADATITILRRMVRGEEFWRPHRTHFYQRASSASQGHDRVVVRVILTNIVLLGAAVRSLFQPLWAGLIAAVSIGVIIYFIYRMEGEKV
ncbi:MAG: glycosyl transferase [Devosiaceae bacterium]|nr:glycosyl transferase [Devosiaceae bacterium]